MIVTNSGLNIRQSRLVPMGIGSLKHLLRFTNNLFEVEDFFDW